MSVKVVATLRLNEDAAFELGKYFEVTEPLMKAAGGKIVQRFNIEETLVGSGPAAMVIIVEYPSREAVDLVFESEAYKSIIPFRDVAFPYYNIQIATQ